MRRFINTYQQNATILLLSGDCNFATDLSDFRYRQGAYIIILYQEHTSQALLNCANESYESSILTNNLPLRRIIKTNPVKMVIKNLPEGPNSDSVKNRLKILLSNTGGRIMSVNQEERSAIIVFASADQAERAKIRLNNEIVGSSHIFLEHLTQEAGESTWNAEQRRPSEETQQTFSCVVNKSIDSTPSGFDNSAGPSNMPGRGNLNENDVQINQDRHEVPILVEGSDSDNSEEAEDKKGQKIEGKRKGKSRPKRKRQD